MATHLDLGRALMRAIGSVTAKLISISVFLLSVSLAAQSPQSVPPAKQRNSSYMPVVDTEDFATIHARMSSAKAGVMKRQMELLSERYDLSNRPASGVVMDRTKSVPVSYTHLRAHETRH